MPAIPFDGGFVLSNHDNAVPKTMDVCVLALFGCDPRAGRYLWLKDRLAGLTSD